MKKKYWVLAGIAFVAVLFFNFVSSWNAPKSQTVPVTVIAINDFHGNLEPSQFRIPDAEKPGETIKVNAGGIEALSTLVHEIRAEQPNTIVVSAGDNIGASPLVSALLADEPTVYALNQLGLEVSAVGNHEFDRGLKELRRIAGGGCFGAYDPEKACVFGGTFPGARWQYLAANVLNTKTGKKVFPGHFVREVDGERIGFVGAVVKDTPKMVSPSGVEGLTFTDEAEAINREVVELREKGVNTVIALVHQGGETESAYDAAVCEDFEGPIVDITKSIAPGPDFVISAHTHEGYVCEVHGRPVTQAANYGHLATRIDFEIHRRTGDPIPGSMKITNLLVDPAEENDPAMRAIIERAKQLTAPLTEQPVAKLGVSQITRISNKAGESALGDVIADAQLAATQVPDPQAPERGVAVVAFMNPGGIRSDLPVAVRPGNVVTYGDAFTAQPFGNSLVVMTLTGAQIEQLLEQQFDNPGPGENRILQVSEGFTYTWDAAKPVGHRVTDVRLNGELIEPQKHYRVTVNSFLADGRDGFTVLEEGTDRLGGTLDLDALQDYLRAQEQAGRPVGASTPAGRINRLI